MINLTYAGGPTLALPDDLQWADEYDWTPVAQAVTPTLTGALIIETAAQQAGRPITLAGSERSGWMPRALLETLRGWVAVPGRVMALTLHDGRSFAVQFRQGERPLEAQPVLDVRQPAADDWYVVTLRFIEV